jgi:hypothetical protein
MLWSSVVSCRRFVEWYGLHLQVRSIIQARNQHEACSTTAGFLLGLLLDHEDWGATFLRNVCGRLLNDTALQPRRLYSYYFWLRLSSEVIKNPLSFLSSYFRLHVNMIWKKTCSPIVVSWLMLPVVLYANTIVLEENVTTIFRAEICRVRSPFDYIIRLK